MSRTLIWWSTGAASFVAAQLTLRDNPAAIVVRCETGNEDPDNYRFEADAMRHLNASVTLLRSTEYADVWDVWQKRRYMAGVNGAPCTSEMKIAPRLAFQKPNDMHVFGYTADREDVERFERLKKNYFELKVRAPLIEAGITKAASLALVQRAGLELPRSYAMGFPNANCLGTGCVKATSPITGRSIVTTSRRTSSARLSMRGRLARGLLASMARGASLMRFRKIGR